MRKVVVIVAVLTAIALSACNVTRTITTTSSSIQKCDTTVIIQSKTVESYDATKRMY